MQQTNTENILIVDNDDAIKEALTIIFQDEKYSVHTCSEERCLYDVKKWKPSVIILDVPYKEKEKEVKDIVKKIKRKKQFAFVPIVITSTDTRFKKEEFGAESFLAKPFDLPVLINTVNHLVH